MDKTDKLEAPRLYVEGDTVTVEHLIYPGARLAHYHAPAQAGSAQGTRQRTIFTTAT